MKTILITGATGFLGEHVLAARPSQWRTIVFARPTSRLEGLPKDVSVRLGDLADAASLEKALDGVDILMNLASLGFGHAPAIVQACRGAKLSRAVFIGTTAVFTTLPAPSKSVRLEAEAVLAASGLPYTLLRPTMIYGTPRDRNIWRLINFLRWAPAVPLVEGGRRLQQPVFVSDVARAAWDVLERPETIGGAYNLAGAEALPMAEMVAEVLSALGRRAPMIPVPLRLALAGAAAARAVPFLPKLTKEQVLRLNEDKAFDIEPARAAFGYAPLAFAEGLQRELKWLPPTR